MEIRDASALVTGAGRGIGRAIALALAREGARVTVVSRTATELDTLVGEIEAVGGRGVAFAGDLRSASACAGAVAAAVECFGGLQILVNNAGLGVHANVADTSDEDWDAVLGTNLTAAFRLTRAALPHLARRGGHVLMVSSLAGRTRSPALRPIARARRPSTSSPPLSCSRSVPRASRSRRSPRAPWTPRSAARPAPPTRPGC